MGLYLFGVTAREIAAAMERLGPIGLPDADGTSRAVAAVTGGALAMLASSTKAEHPLPLRRNLEAHQRVLRAAFDLGTIVPMKFGQVASGKRAVERLLKSQAAALHGEIEQLDGKMEMVLRVRWEVESIYDHLVSRHAELRAFRDQVFRPGVNPSRAEQIELGRLFAQISAEERRAHTARVLEAFEGVAERHFEGPLHGEKAVANLALLVGRNRQAEFEERVHRASRLLDECFALEFSGPWPPSSFVEVELDLAGLGSL